MGAEHYVTLFDVNFVPAGLSLYASLERHAGPFVLWVLCMDAAAEAQLRRLALPHLRIIPLAEVETEALRAVKGGRSRGEYCWTITPFSFDFVFARAPEAERVTYLDADVFFFSSPAPFLQELEQSGAHVLITEHAYAPEYDQSKSHGRFCVQFVTFRRTPQGQAVLRWWQDRCLEWCFGRVEAGKFGDQKYLDDWPTRFGADVHVLRQPHRTLGPWNVALRLPECGPGGRPVMYHFHRFRIVAAERLLLYRGYRVGQAAEAIYAEYVQAMVAALRALAGQGLPVPTLPEDRSAWDRLKRLVLAALGRIRYAPLSLQAGERGP